MKKLFCLLMALVCSFVFFTGCGSKSGIVDNTKEDTTTLKIVALERGYGVKMIEAWAERFEELHDGVTVDVKVEVEEGNIGTYFELGEAYSDYDLFFDIQQCAAQLELSNRGKFEGYDKALMDYTDIYNSKVYGENVTLGEKINQSVKAEMQCSDLDGKYYAFPWAVALQSFVVNTKVVKAALGSDYKLPNTTDELYAFCSAIKQAGYTPLAYPGQLDYWRSAFCTWWAQYEGLEEYYHFYEGKYYDEISENYVYGPQIYQQQGRLESLKEMERLLAYDSDETSFHLANVNDYNIKNFTTLQKAFVHSDAASNNARKYAMMPNGDWLAQEAGTASSDPILMISTPVISSVINQCGTIDSDAELSALIDAIDAGNTSLTGDGYDVSRKDYDRIKEARNIVFSQSSNHIAYSPVYANAKTLIKEFLLFAASDEGIEIYRQNVNPGIMPFDYDYQTTDMFLNSVINLYNKNYLPFHNKTLLAASGTVKMMTTNNGWYEAVLGVPKTSRSYMSAQQIFESEFESEDSFMMSLRNLGLIK